ncbi:MULTISPECIES: hypothetical protein [unclassified Endozoicomonas]|uniref:hypothetical protein n=1 Tax=unclassified Endozoicomonas TaxID=2644528 RepID=UPI0021486EE2|nr:MULTISPECIES: hypothetical protein [unclassified Endozoicomonas]
MFNKLYPLLFFIFSFCSWTWATVEIIGPDTFTYTDSTGSKKTRQIRGYTRPENLEQYLQLAAANSETTLKIDRDLKERRISKVYFIQFSADPEGIVDQSENIGFIVILNDGTALLSFDYLSSPMKIASTYDQTKARDRLESHIYNHAVQFGFLDQGSMESVLWSMPSSSNQNFKQLGFRRDKKKTTRYQATFLIPYLNLSGQGTLEIRNIGTYQYTILESASVQL